LEVLEFWEIFVRDLYGRLGNRGILCNAGILRISKLSVFNADFGFDSRRLHHIFQYFTSKKNEPYKVAIRLTQLTPGMQYAGVFEEYPRNQIRVDAAFSTEAARRYYLARLRWPDGFNRPHCGGCKS
jgi:hypothetical protein